MKVQEEREKGRSILKVLKCAKVLIFKLAVPRTDKFVFDNDGVWVSVHAP